jgi:hypothetical protein
MFVSYHNTTHCHNPEDDLIVTYLRLPEDLRVSQMKVSNDHWGEEGI